MAEPSLIVFGCLAGAGALFATTFLQIREGFWLGLVALLVNIGAIIGAQFDVNSAVLWPVWYQATAGGFVVGSLWTLLGRIMSKDIPF